MSLPFWFSSHPKSIKNNVKSLTTKTGYNSDAFGTPVPTYGRSGILLAQKYQPSLQSLYGVAVDDFPNYLNFLGPNSSSFETSVMELFELQAYHSTLVVKFLWEKMGKKEGGDRFAVVPKESRVKSWTESLREGQRKLPPAREECRSYYKVRLRVR